MKSEKSPGQKDGTHNECFGAFHFWAIRIGKDFTWTLQYVFKKLVIFKVTTDPSLQLQHNIDMILNCYSRILLVTEQIRWSQVLKKRYNNCPTPSPLMKKGPSSFKSWTITISVICFSYAFRLLGRYFLIVHDLSNLEPGDSESHQVLSQDISSGNNTQR